MHLLLCICFKPLRAKNYLIVWCNLIHKRITLYPNSTYKEIFISEYRKVQKFHGINEADTFGAEQGEEDSSGDNEDVNAVGMLVFYFFTFCLPELEFKNSSERREPKELSLLSLNSDSMKSLATAVGDGEERECTKQIFESESVPSSSSKLRQCNDDEAPAPPPRLKKRIAKLHEEENQEANSHISTRGRTETHYLNDAVKVENNGVSNVSDARSQLGFTSRIRRYLPLTQRRDSSVIRDIIDILTPDFTNKRDLASARENFLRQKRDEKDLKKRLQAQKRVELAMIAKYEAKQKAISSSIQLMLQILQMMASFAILVGNIRKTFIPAHFNWIKHGHNDSEELMMLWRCTVFLDVLLFWISVTWAYCLQCHLCCRLGLLKFWIWMLTLGLIGGILVLYPMSYIQDNLDTSWCRFKPNSTLAQYQPNW
ncbi:unnamed protein product [Litomosoides sigmodontis]|uniref:Uncharacterized protein n=1 Tax=Litomosoides sigmodontis TaxID=42156 RepID=A0A3P6UQJ6_LITSI|nr:unnamed protein product [Litomosoides sigmodontis]